MVMLPLYEIDPPEGKTRPYVTYGLIALNISVSLFVLTAPAETYQAVLDTMGAVPAAEMRNVPGNGLFPPEWTLVTSMFLHRDWWHLATNMLFLWIFGDNIEDAIGHFRFLVFYLLCGVAGVLCFIVIWPHSTVILVGASAGIAGVLAAYLMLRPYARIEILVVFWPLPCPAYVAIGLWILLQAVQLQGEEADGVAYTAHLGGAFVGALLIVVMRPRGIKLFNRMPAADDSDEASKG